MVTTTKKVALGAAALATIGATAVGVSAHDLPDNEQRPAWRTEAHEALESGDYDAWLQAHQQAFEAKTSQDRFEKLQEFHQLVTDGNHEEARAFAEENDLRPPHGKRGHHVDKHRGEFRGHHVDDGEDSDEVEDDAEEAEAETSTAPAILQGA